MNGGALADSHGSDEPTEDPAVGQTPAPDPLPEAPLFSLLRIVERDIAVDRIDRIWIFPPRRLEAGETALLVVSALPEVDPERRRVYAAHYTAPAEASEPRLVLDEFGTAPVERVGRLVEDVAERLKDEPTANPRAARIGGDPARWQELLHSLAERHLDEAADHARLRRDPWPLDPSSRSHPPGEARGSGQPGDS